MRRFIKSFHTHIAVLMFVAFWVGAYVIPNYYVLLISNSLVLAGATAVCIAYLPMWWKFVRAPRTDDPKTIAMTHLVLGIVYAWGASAVWRVWSLLWLTSGQDPVLVNNDIVAFMQATVFFGACYHLTSPGALNKDMPALRWIVVGIVVGCALALATLLALVNPDTREIANMIKPWIPR